MSLESSVSDVPNKLTDDCSMANDCEKSNAINHSSLCNNNAAAEVEADNTTTSSKKKKKKKKPKKPGSGSANGGK